MRPLLLLISLCCMLNSCGISKYGIKNAWVFTEERFPGNIQVDDQGNQVTKAVMVETAVFLETKTKELPVWTSLEIDGQSYQITENKLVQSPFTIGKNKMDESPVTIVAAEGNFLYRISIEPVDPQKVQIKNIKLIGESVNGKITVHVDKKPVPLLPQMVP